jgi:hypothetical protein
LTQVNEIKRTGSTSRWAARRHRCAASQVTDGLPVPLPLHAGWFEAFLSSPWEFDASLDTALIFAEIYRHNGEWKFKAIGQGYAGGLGPLARNFGVDI